VLLLIKKLGSDEFGEQVHKSSVRQEEVIGIRELSFIRILTELFSEFCNPNDFFNPLDWMCFEVFLYRLVKTIAGN